MGGEGGGAVLRTGVLREHVLGDGVECVGCVRPLGLGVEGTRGLE